MNILLVAPHTPKTFWSFDHALRFISKRAAHPPLGLLTVAGMLPREWNLKLVDMNVTKLRDRDIRWADYVMISAMLVEQECVQEVAGRCRKQGIPVIGGGPMFTPEPDNFAYIDHLVVGEAEELIDEIVADMRHGSPRPMYQAGRFPAITETPIPRWDLVKMKHYASMTVQFSRGCPFDCEFCDIVALNGRVPRLKEPAQLLAELEALIEQGWKGSTFLVDDNFIGNRRKVKDLLRAIIAWRQETGAQLIFLTEASVNLADDPELLQLMAEAGFDRVFLGIETPSAEGLKECSKFQNIKRDLVEAVHTIQAAGIEVMGGFIVGFDSDTPDIFERQFEFIQKARVVTAMVGLLQAVPRTKLYQRLSSEGRLLGDSFGNNTSAALNFKPILDRDYLYNNYRKLMQKLYEPEAFYDRAREFMARHKPMQQRIQVRWPELKALFQSMWVMGVLHHGRRAYWRFLTGTLVKHPAHFGLGVTFAIYGYHFRQVAKTL